MTKYELFCGSIREIEADRETDDSIWVRGQRRKKRSDWRNYFNTFESAREFAIAKANGRISHLKAQMDYAERDLKDAKEIKLTVS